MLSFASFPQTDQYFQFFNLLLYRHTYFYIILFSQFPISDQINPLKERENSS